MEPRTVLIVEDHPDNRLIYASLLEHNGYTVLQAENGRTGVALARSARPDVILMDLAMPVMDGITATEVLKADPGTASIPVIAVTAHDALLSHAPLFAAWLGKPVEPARLLGTIADVIASDGAAPPAGGIEPLPG